MYDTKDDRKKRTESIQLQISALEWEQREISEKIRRLVNEQQAIYIIDELEELKKNDRTRTKGK